MRRKMFLVAAFAVVLALISGVAVQASGSVVQVETDQAAFLSETGAASIPFPENADTALPNHPWATLHDYSCTSNVTGIDLGQVTVTAPAAGGYICFIGTGWDAGSNNTNPSPPSPTIVADGEDDYHVVSFAEPVSAVGFELLTNKYASEEITLDFADGTNEVIADSALDTATNKLEFVGFQSAEPIVSVAINTTGGANQNEGIVAIWTAAFDDEGPVTSNVLADPNPAGAGSNVAVTANVDDTDTGGSNIASAEYSLDEDENWSPMEAADSVLDGVSEDVVASFAAPSMPGIYNLCVRGTDAAGNVGAETCTMFVVYDPDGGFVTGGGWIDSPVGAYKGHEFDQPALVWDQGFETGTDGWFDSTNSWYGAVTQVASGTDGIASAAGSWHAVMQGDSDSGPFSRFDGYRDTWTGSWTAEIDVYLDPSWAAGTGFDYTVAASGSDGEHQRDYIFHVTKDTSTGKLLVAGSNNTNFAPREDLENINHYEVTTAGWYTLQHVFYEESGALAVDLNLLDAGGNVLFTETRFNAADTIPNEVGGNRYAWFTFINVDGGIAVDNHELVVPTSPGGKANFGFVSRYKKGASVPEGNAQFVFQTGDLNFHSDVQDWLIVTGSDYAKFKGEGTINGEGSYKFQIWAGDDNPDTFRIKIWYEDGGNEVVVYDNGMNQAIGGGNIVVHSK